jgi:hypothetical protein
MAAGGDQGVQGGDGYLGGACEDELHLMASQTGTGTEQRTGPWHRRPERAVSRPARRKPYDGRVLTAAQKQG